MISLASLKEILKKAGFILLGIILAIWLVQVVIGLFNRGEVTVTTQPAGAEVYINGAKSGVTPFNSGGLNPGSYSVKVSLSGYLTESKKISLEAGKKEELTFTLTPVSQAKTVTEGTTSDLFFGSSGKLYYSLATAPLRKELWSYDPSTEQKQQLLGADRLMANEVYWSGDGRAVIVDWEGSAWALSYGVLNKLPFKGFGFSWSPDGTEVTFANHRFFSVGDPEGLNTYNFTTGKVTNLYQDTSVSGKKTRWSPDGAKILYFVYSDEGLGQTFVFNRDGSNKTTLLDEELTEVGDMRWAQDSSRIYLSLGDTVFSRNLAAKTGPVFSLGKPALIFDVDSEGNIIAGSKQSGEVWRIGNGTGKLIYSQGELTLTGIAASPSSTAVSSADRLLILPY